MIKFVLPLGFNLTRKNKENIQRDFYSLDRVRVKNPRSAMLISDQLIEETQLATSFVIEDTPYGCQIIITTDSEQHKAIASYLLCGVSYEYIVHQVVVQKVG